MWWIVDIGSRRRYILFASANSILIFHERLLVRIRPPPSNVDENDISQLCTPNIEEGIRSVGGTTNLIGAYRLRCSLFIRIGIKVFDFGSIEVDQLFCFVRAHVCFRWLRRAGITTASRFRNLGIKKPAGNTLRLIAQSTTPHSQG